MLVDELLFFLQVFKKVITDAGVFSITYICIREKLISWVRQYAVLAPCHALA
jgi:hypothetical protein